MSRNADQEELKELLVAFVRHRKATHVFNPDNKNICETCEKSDNAIERAMKYLGIRNIVVSR